MALGGASFVTGAMGFEMVGGWYRTSRGEDSGYQVIVAIEEGLEMVGASIFVLSLLTLLRLLQDANGPIVQVVSNERDANVEATPH